MKPIEVTRRFSKKENMEKYSSNMKYETMDFTCEVKYAVDNEDEVAEASRLAQEQCMSEVRKDIEDLRGKFIGAK
jgi:hypothetical protein